MNVIKCTACNLHYDADKYSICPHCQANGVVESTDSVAEPTKPKRGLFGKKEKFDDSSIHSIPDHSVAKTFSAFDDIGSDGATDSSSDLGNPEESSKTDYPVDTSEEVIFDMPDEDDIPDEQEGQEVASSEGSFAQEIANLNKNNSGRTLSYFSFGDSAEQQTNSTPAGSANTASNKPQSSPVVGWLVCTKGNHLGESFQLFDGNNSIGRSDSNDVVLFKENSVSSNKHAIITYEPRKRVFYIQSGDSHGLTYLNDELVMGTPKINTYDLIEFGQSAFVFIPLCSERFSWEDYIGR